MLASLSDGEQRDTVWLREQLARHFDVSSEERARLLPSGTGRLYDNRVAWAFTHLWHAGAIDRPRRKRDIRAEIEMNDHCGTTIGQNDTSAVRLK